MLRIFRSLTFSFPLCVAFGTGCESKSPPPPPEPTARVQTAAPAASVSATAAPTRAPAADAGSVEAVPPKPWEGPFLGILRSSTGIYAEPSARRELKVGYAEEGARVPVYPERVDGEGCASGWYRVVQGGYICGGHGTTNLEDPRVRNGRRPPDLDEILPYKYARNAAHGTPLYRSVPSLEQMRRFEPYRFEDKKKAEQEKTNAAKKMPAPKPRDEQVDERTRQAREDQARRMAALQAAQRAMLGEAAAKKLRAAEAVNPSSVTQHTAPDAGAQKEWWEDENPNLHQLSLQDLQTQDPVLAQRMVKGFYIAVDRQFGWNDRQWYRSTGGLIAPVDRFHAAPRPAFKGVELDEEWALPIGWVYGWNKNRTRYQIDRETKVVRRSGSLERHAAVNLTGEELQIGKTTYVESADGFWMRKRDLRIANPGPPPADLNPTERWLGIDVTNQTAILYEGTRPLFATLVSTGKTHRDPKRDHSTPTGEWRIEMKHITATMDGDGTASDLPYSIEAVPYVMYYYKSYAVHGAFWHQNYGVKMSHGCINLSPLDAKYIFFNTDPPVPEGWHGAWSSPDRPGSRVVVYE